MKKIYLYFSIFCVSLFTSCDKEDVSTDFEFGIEKSYKIQWQYQSDDHELKFKITEINDSRCPSDVECIWAGKADVSIEVESPVSGNLVLSTIENGFDHRIDTLGNYSFQLVNVLPYPVSTKTIDLEDYEVTLKIEKLGNP